MGLRYGSLFSGVDAASLAWGPLGWTAAFFSEIEPFPSSVPNLGDITATDFVDRAKALGPVDVLVGGPPCTSFSQAGLRNSLSDKRGNLTLRFEE